MADIPSVTRDALTGERVGRNVMADVPSVTRDALTGERVGRNVMADMLSVVREVLIAEPPFRISHVSRDVLMSTENEPLTQARIMSSYRQAVVMVRPTMRLPSTVKSPQIVPTLRQQAVQHVTRTWARSGDFAATLRMQSVGRRNVLIAPQMHSATRVGALVEQVTRSRGKTYVAVSALYTRTQRQLVVSHRVVTLAPNVRTAISVGHHHEQVVLSRLASVIVVMTEAHVGSFAQQAVVADTRPVPHSAIDAKRMRHLTVMRHVVVPPGIDDRAATLGQQVVIERAPATVVPFGMVNAATVREQVVIERHTATQQSSLYAAGERMMTVQHRDTYAPAFAMGRNTSTLRQQILAKRGVGQVRGFDLVKSLHIGFILHRDTPRPIDVIDPAIGRHAASLSMISVHHRPTTPPAGISGQTRWVFNVVGQVALGDAFPEPDYPPPEPSSTDVRQVGEQVVHGDRGGWEPVSVVTVRAVGAMIALGDNAGWADASKPMSDVSVFTVQHAIAMGDVFPDMSEPQSDAEVAALFNVVALGDASMPDPTLPLSEIQVAHLVAATALGDADTPDPMIPLSDVRVRHLAAFTALRDPDLSGQFGMSEIRVPSIVEFLVIHDQGLVGIPLRSGPRPVISVSMS